MANVSLAIDDNGKLGRVLKTWSVTTSAPFGTAFNSVTTINDIKGVHLKAGDSYYLLLTPGNPTVQDLWNINDISFNGTRLLSFGSAKALQTDVPLSAFAIFGKATPPVDAAVGARAVPGPDLGAGLPGVAACVGLLGWLFRKKNARNFFRHFPKKPAIKQVAA